jgi:multidrug resistance efflux pump
MKNIFFISYNLVFCLLLFVSCNSKEDGSIPLYNVVSADFEDIITIDGYVESVNSTNINCPQGISGEIVMMVDDGVLVKEGDIVCIIKDEDLLSTFEDYKTSLEMIEADLAKTIANHSMQLALLEAQVKTNEAQTSIAELDSIQLEYSSDNQKRIKLLELESTAIEKDRYKKKLKTLKIIQRSELRRLEMRHRMFDQRMSTVEEKVASLEVRAPHAGMILRSVSPMTGRKFGVGDRIWNGVTLFTIPDMKIMKVMIAASEGSYKRIEIDHPITYTFDALPGDTAWGKMVKKSPIGKPIKRNSKVKIFDLEASVDSSLQIPTPGLSAECKVMLQRVTDTIVVPQIAVFEVDSIKVVYVKLDKGFELRQVITGLSSPKETVIDKGLYRNEKIALSKPASSLVIQEKMLTED